MASVVARVRALDNWHFDIALGVAVAVLGVAEAMISIGPGSDVLAPVAALLLLPLPLAFRRRQTVAAIAGFYALSTISETLNGGYDDLGTPFLMVFVLAFTVGADTEGRETWLALLVSAGGLILYLSQSPSSTPDDYPFAILVGTLPPFIAGRIARSRTRVTEELAAKRVALEAQLEERERSAVHDERARIARELHDVVAHSLSVMVVQAGGARAVVDRDRELAARAFDAIEDSGREALGEMRRLLGMLREEGEEPAIGPQPTLEDLPAMVDRARAAGMAVDLEVTGQPREYTSGMQLAAYRIVQEALTNSFKHSGSRHATVEVAHSARGLGLRIADRGPGGDAEAPAAGLSADGGGNGLRGMRERVTLYGGSFEAGASPEGGFVVEAWLEAARRSDEEKPRTEVATA